MKRSQMVKKLAKTLENSKVANISSTVLAEVLLSECLDNGMLPTNFQFYDSENVPNSDILLDVQENCHGNFCWEPENG